MIELERTYLAKELPKDLEKFPSKEMVDIYIPIEAEHPSLRLRKNGNHFEMTKKEPVKEGDNSKMLEQTIILRKDEFQALQSIPGKKVAKIRYAYNFNGQEMEIDVFQDDLRGLVLVDIEFKTEEEKKNFTRPDFCLTEVTQEKFIAGGMLCGKSYGDIQQQLDKLGYQKLEN